MQAIGHLLSPSIKLWTLVALFGITGFLALRSPLALLVVPTLGWRFVSQESHYWGTDWHYNAIVMPVVFIALVDALVAVRRSRWTWLRAYTRAVLPLALGIAIVGCTRLPFAGLTDPVTYRTNPRAPAVRAALATMPAGARVEGNVMVLTPLAAHHRATWLGLSAAAPDYIMLDVRGLSPSVRDDPAGYGAVLHPGNSYAQVFSDAGIVVVQRQSS